MNIINLEHLTKNYSGTPVLQDVSFTLDAGEKVGIIGVNGTGKSTLLKILAGKEAPDQGTLTKAQNVTLAYLPQTPVFEPGETALSAVVHADQVHRKNEEEWTREAEARTLLNHLGISDFNVPCEQLSGGQRKRVALAGALLSRADVLILDEPTNHLDAFMAEWLENYLVSLKSALVLVTHDRYFLDAVTHCIVEIDKGKLYRYEANYLEFLTLKEERENAAYAEARKIKSLLRVEKEWMMRGAEARRTKQKKQIDQYEEHLNYRGPREDPVLEMTSVASRMGRTTVELKDLTVGYDKPLIEPFTYIFLKQDRVGIAGPNGCGKTTLMKVLTGEKAPLSGTITLGQTIRIGYYAQEIQNDPSTGLAYMDPSLRVIDYIKNTAEYLRTAEGLVSASQMLERFLFSPEKQYTRIEKLSGGEKRRLNLLRVLMEQPNVLILDEPTNDLDILTMMVLENYLDAFDGIVIAVSHDRYFLDRVVRRMFVFEEGKIRQYEGGYTLYRQKKEAEEEKAAALAAGNTKNSPGKTGSGKNAGSKPTGSAGEGTSSGGYTNVHAGKLKFTYKEQKEFETIDQDIEALETRISAIDEEMTLNATNSVRLSELQAEKEEKEAALLEKMDRWVYLNELAEKIEAQKQA